MPPTFRATSPGDASSRPVSRDRVLIVEDDAPIRRVLATLMEDEGYDHREATNGVEALEIMRQWRPSVILLDLMMPVMDGRAFRALQRAEPELREIPVVLVSGGRQLETVAAELGAVAVFSKPFDIDELARAVHAAILRP